MKSGPRSQLVSSLIPLLLVCQINIVKGKKAVCLHQDIVKFACYPVWGH